MSQIGQPPSPLAAWAWQLLSFRSVGRPCRVRLNTRAIRTRCTCVIPPSLLSTCAVSATRFLHPMLTHRSLYYVHALWTPAHTIPGRELSSLHSHFIRALAASAQEAIVTEIGPKLEFSKHRGRVCGGGPWAKLRPWGATHRVCAPGPTWRPAPRSQNRRRSLALQKRR
jgi:hypothetical protein